MKKNFAVLCCFFCMVPTPVLAGWNHTQWGMSKEQTEKIIGQELPHEENSSLYTLPGEYKSFGSAFTVNFYIPENGLERVSMVDTSLAAKKSCETAVSEFDQIFETVEHDNCDTGGRIRLWQTEDTFVEMHYTAHFGGPLCTITYLPAENLETTPQRHKSRTQP